MKYKHVTIHWWDATSKAEWVAEKSLPVLSKVTTSGYLIRKNRQTITICGSFSKVDGEAIEYGDCITIPRPWIVKK